LQNLSWFLRYDFYKHLKPLKNLKNMQGPKNLIISPT
jgi:hypothetical protein